MNPYDSPAPEPTQQPTVRSSVSIWGLFSCIVFLFSVYRFAVLWHRIGRVPVARALETAGIHSGALKTMTMMFFVLAVAGCLFGAFGVWRNRTRREVGIAGLVLNCVMFVILLLLTSTGGP